MEKHRRKSNVNIPICIACVLFCLTMISIHLVSGLYAKYTTSSGGSDYARVIRFGNLTITESGDFCTDGKLMIIPGVDLKKKALANFDGSESATYVFVEVMLSDHWSTTDNRTFSILSGTNVLMQWTVADDWTYLTKGTGTYIYYKELAPNTSLSTGIIKGEKVTVSENITKDKITGMTGIYIKFRADVVQSGGFENAAAAWASVSSK